MIKRYILIILMLLLVSIMSFSVSATVDWYNESYNYRMNVSFVTLNQNNTNFISEINLTTVCGNDCNPTKTDIMLVEYDGSINTELGFTYLNKSMETTTLNIQNSFIVFIGGDMKNSYYIYYNSTTTTARNTSHFRFFESWDDKTGTSDTWDDNWLFATASRYLTVVNTPSETLKNSITNSIGNNPTVCKWLNNQNTIHNEYVYESMYYQDSNISDNGGAVVLSIGGGTSSCTTPNINQPAIMIQDGSLGYICDAVYGVDTGIDLEANRWYSLRIVNHNTSTPELWVDDLNFQNCTKGNATTLKQLKIAYGNGFGGSSLYTFGKDLKIDSVKVYYDLDARTYRQDYVTTYGLKESDVSEIIIQDIKLVNQSKQDWGLTFTQFTNPFMINVNATFEDLTAEDGQCNYTVLNTSHIFFNMGNNRTLTNTDSLEFLIDNDDIGNLQHDRYFFRLCHLPTGTAKNVQVYINDNSTIHKTISNTVIPSCNIGFHEERFLFKDYITSEQLNLSLRCSGCTGVNNIRVIKLSDYPFSHNIESSRTHSIIENEVLNYNATSKLFEDNEFHVFSLNGNLTMNISCNNTDDSIEVQVLGQQPIAKFLEIIADNTIYPFTANNTITESATNFTIKGDCSGAIITSSQLNITYNSNDTLIKSVNAETITLTSTDLYSDVLYNAILWCDTANNDTLLVSTFWANDTVNPIITWVNPLNTNNTQMTFNTTNLLELSFTDINLFAYDVRVIDPNGVTKYSFNLSNINTSTYTFNENIVPDILGVWKINTTISDDHTLNKIPDYKHDILEKELIFKMKKYKPNKEEILYNISIEYVGVYDVDKIETVKSEDRYKFKFKFRLGIDKFNKEVDHKFRVSCDDIIYRQNSDYSGLFVCGNEYWIDFESDDLISYSVKKIFSNTYEISTTMNAKENIMFKSIGGLNKINEIVEFTTVLPVDAGFVNPNISNYDFTTLPNIILIFILVFFYIALLTLALTFKNIILWGFSFVIGLFLGLLFISFSGWLATVFFLFNVALSFAVVDKTK